MSSPIHPSGSSTPAAFQGATGGAPVNQNTDRQNQEAAAQRAAAAPLSQIANTAARENTNNNEQILLGDDSDTESTPTPPPSPDVETTVEFDDQGRITILQDGTPMSVVVSNGNRNRDYAAVDAAQADNNTGSVLFLGLDTRGTRDPNNGQN